MEYDLQNELWDTPAVQAALPQAKELIQFGVTPLTVFYATEAVSGLVDRLVLRSAIKEDRIILDAAENSEYHKVGFVVPHSMLLSEVLSRSV